MTKCNSQFRLGFLDGIQDRQTESKRDILKMRRVKNSEYMRGYESGIKTTAGKAEKPEKGNKK